MHESENWKWSRSVVSDSLWPYGLQPTRLLRPWDLPVKSTGVGCNRLLRRYQLVKPYVYMAFIVGWNIKGYKSIQRIVMQKDFHNSKERKKIFFQMNKVWPLGFQIFSYFLMFWLGQTGPIPSKSIIHLDTWWQYFNKTKIVHFPHSVLIRNQCFTFSGNTEIINLISFL